MGQNTVTKNILVASTHAAFLLNLMVVKYFFPHIVSEMIMKKTKDMFFFWYARCVVTVKKVIEM